MASAKTATRSSSRWTRSSAVTAVLTDDGHEPDWPEADVVIGNPPFLGGKLLRWVLGDEYVEDLQRLYGERGSRRGRPGVPLVRQGQAAGH